MANAISNIIISGVDKTQAAFRSVNSNLKTMEERASSINMIFARFLPILGTASLVGFGKNIIDAADNMNDLAQRTGISIDRIAAWDLATKQSGTSIEALTAALGRGSRFMVDHSDDLKTLGINAKTSEELIFQLSDVIASMPADDPRRVALAMQVLGKSAGELVPLLAQGSEELRKLVARGAELAAVYKELGPEADTFNDNLEATKLRAEVLGARVITPLIKNINATQSALLNSDSAWEKWAVSIKYALGNLSAFSMVWNLFTSEAQAADNQTEKNAKTVEDLNKQLGFLKLALQSQAAELAKAQDSTILKGYKQVADATKKQITEFQALGNAMTSAFIEAGKAAEDALSKAQQFQKNAKDIRQSGQDRIRQLDGQNQTPEEADRETNIALQDALNKADSARKQADLQRLEGNTKEAERLLEISEQQAQRASDLSDKLDDEGLKRQRILDSTEALARVEESREQVQTKIAAEETARQDALQKQMIDNAATVEGLKSSLIEIEKLIDGINSKAANIKISTEQEAYNKTLAEIQAIEAKLANIAKGVIVPVQISANATGAYDSSGNAVYRDSAPVFSLAGGGPISGPGTATSDSIFARLSNGEYVIKAAAVQKYGLGFMHALNNMHLPEYAQGGAVQRAIFPSIQSMVGGAGRSMQPLNLNFPWGSFSVQAEQATALSLQRGLRIETMKRGGRG
jgi:hypothetical protein